MIDVGNDCRFFTANGKDDRDAAIKKGRTEGYASLTQAEKNLVDAAAEQAGETGRQAILAQKK